MSSWDGKSQAGLWGYQIFVATLRYAGLRTAYVLLRFVSLYYFFFSKESNKVINIYLKERLKLDWWESAKARYKNYYVFGQTLIDRVAVMSGLGTRFTFDFDGEEHLHQLVKEGKGGMLISAHIGNWEVAGHLLYRVKARINVVMHEAEHQKIKSFLDKAKGKNTMSVIVIKEDLSHVYDISLALQRGEFICMHGDRFMPWAKTLQTEFLGKNAYFPQGPFALAVGFKVPVCYVFAMKEGDFHYHFSSSPSKIYQVQKGEKKEGLVQSALQDFVLEAERTVKNYPFQWFNYYDFWAEKTNLTVSADYDTSKEKQTIITTNQHDEFLPDRKLARNKSEV